MANRDQPWRTSGRRPAVQKSDENDEIGFSSHKRPSWFTLGANVTVSSAPCSCGSCGAVCRVRVNAPWPSCIIMGCNLKGGDPIGGLGLIRRLEGFIAHAWNETERSPTRYKAGLVRRLNRNFALVASVVKAHPCLRLDFQVFLRSDGEVFNVDLDRCFDRSSSAVSPLSNRLATDSRFRRLISTVTKSL